jgi:hypothetical protein
MMTTTATATALSTTVSEKPSSKKTATKKSVTKKSVSIDRPVENQLETIVSILKSSSLDASNKVKTTQDEYNMLLKMLNDYLKSQKSVLKKVVPVKIIKKQIIKHDNHVTEIAKFAEFYINSDHSTKTRKCINTPCTRRVCNFAHSLSDIKLLPHIALFNKYAPEFAQNPELSYFVFLWILEILKSTYFIYSPYIDALNIPETSKHVLITINKLLYKCESKTILYDIYTAANTYITFDQFKCILMFLNLFGQKHLPCINVKCTFAANCNHNCTKFGPIIYLCTNCLTYKKCDLKDNKLCIHFVLPKLYTTVKPKSGMSSEYNIKFLPTYMRNKIPISQNEIDIYLLYDCNKYNYIKKMMCKTLSTTISVTDLSITACKYIYYRRNCTEASIKNPMNILEWLSNQLVTAELKIAKIEEYINKTMLLLENAESDYNIRNIEKFQSKLYTLKNNSLPAAINQMRNIKSDIRILNYLRNKPDASYMVARSICRCVPHDLQDFFPIEIVELFMKEENFKNSMIPFREILKEFVKLKLLDFHVPIQLILDSEFPQITSDLYDETIIEIQKKIGIRRNELELISYKNILNLFDKIYISNMPLFINQSDMNSYTIQDMYNFIYKGGLLHYFPKPHVKENYRKNFLNREILVDDILTYFINYQYDHSDDNSGFITVFKKVNTLSSEIYRWTKVEIREKEINDFKEKLKIIESVQNENENEKIITKTNKQKKDERKQRAIKLMKNINEPNKVVITEDPLEIELNNIYENIIKLNKIEQLNYSNLTIGTIKITIKNMLYFKLQYISKYIETLKCLCNDNIAIKIEPCKNVSSIEETNDEFYNDNWITKDDNQSEISDDSSDTISDTSSESSDEVSDKKIIKPLIEEPVKVKQMTFAERKKLVMENRKKLAAVQVISKVNKNSNQEFEQIAINELSKQYDPSSITKQMIVIEVKKLITNRRITSINKRKDILTKERLEFEKNKNTYKNFGPKDAYTIETQLSSKLVK